MHNTQTLRALYRVINRKKKKKKKEIPTITVTYSSLIIFDFCDFNRFVVILYVYDIRFADRDFVSRKRVYLICIVGITKCEFKCVVKCRYF